MNVRFWSEDGSQYVTIRPEEFKDCVKKRRKKGKAMPVPKQSQQVAKSSESAVLAIPETEAKQFLLDLIADIEATLQVSGKDGMISLKLGYKTGYQVSLKTSKTGMWFNVSSETLLGCLHLYLQGEFD